jgi:hypothetical protein
MPLRSRERSSKCAAERRHHQSQRLRIHAQHRQRTCRCTCTHMATPGGPALPTHHTARFRARRYRREVLRDAHRPATPPGSPRDHSSARQLFRVVLDTRSRYDGAMLSPRGASHACAAAVHVADCSTHPVTKMRHTGLLHWRRTAHDSRRQQADSSPCCCGLRPWEYPLPLAAASRSIPLATRTLSSNPSSPPSSPLA